MSGKKLTLEEERWLEARDHYQSLLGKLKKGLLIANSFDLEKFSSERAVIALVAVSYFVKNITPTQRYLLAPLLEALEIVEATLEPQLVPWVRRITDVLEGMDAHEGWPPPSITDLLRPLKNFANEVVLPKGVASKLFATVAVEFQLMNGAPLEQALKNVVGSDSRARKRLKDFRYNMKEKNSPKGARQEYFDMMRRAKEQLAGKDASECAELALAAYRDSLGKKS